jgi:dTDP-4-dehydrorhamnose reductase
MRVLVLGVTGMLGNAILRVFVEDGQHDVWGTMRSEGGRHYFAKELQPCLMAGVDVLDNDTLMEAMVRVRPEVVINCVGLIKQLADSKDPLVALPINSMLPHRLAKICSLAGARLIHISTDCVFSGRSGGYLESDLSDAEDLYGKSKFIGELHDLPHAITLRTSIIGHELNSNNALVDWFLAQQDEVKGFAQAIFSGLPTVEFGRVIKDFVLPNPALHGLYHISAAPIDKFTLLSLIADIYDKKILIRKDEQININRSLNSARFSKETGYVAPAWLELIKLMHRNR